MLRFKVFEGGAPASRLNLDGAHLLGTDRVPVRGEIKYVGGELHCEPRTRGATALAIMWSVPGVGRVLVETPRLLERPAPYNLLVELARGQLMRLSQKREDWGLYDHPDGEAYYREINKALELLVEAMATDDEAKASHTAAKSLETGLKVGEALGVYHAGVFLETRRAAGELSKPALGCRLEPGPIQESWLSALADSMQFVQLPFRWSALQPKEGKYDTGAVEKSLQALHARKITVCGTSLVSFDDGTMPAWLVSQAKDYERLRESVARHLKTLLKSFEGHVQAWEVTRGLHARNVFRLSFDQIIELSRMAAMLARQCCPKAPVLLGLTLPWGEYYAADAQTIPPTLYAEMLLQSGAPFDAFGLQIQFGSQHTAQYVRDLMQVSSILDRYGAFGKPIHVTCAGVPSSGLTPVSGYWHEEWSEDVQAVWLRDFYTIALSKPFVESVSWQSLGDGPGPSPWGGLLKKDGTPKKSYQELLALRQRLAVGASS
jgi:hypothetical protein